MRYKPMLAYPVSDKPIDYTDLVFVQPKLDGVRCLIQYDNNPTNEYHPQHLRVTAYSRTGKVWKNIDHILFNLLPFFQLNPDVVLDGELYNHDFKDNFEQIISMVRKTKPTDEARAESAENVQFHCYDIVDTTKTFKERNKFITQNVLRNHCVYHVDTTQIHSQEAAKERHRINLKASYEGSIVRTNDTYQCKRSHSLRKFKDFSDAEATIIGYEEGKGKRVGTLGKFMMQDDEGKEFGCPPGKGYNYKNMANMLKNVHNYIGKRATFTYFERTKAGSYRHPLFKCIRNYE